MEICENNPRVIEGNRLNTRGSCFSLTDQNGIVGVNSR